MPGLQHRLQGLPHRLTTLSRRWGSGLALFSVLLLHAPATGSTTERLEELTRSLADAVLQGEVSYTITMSGGDEGAVIATLSDFSPGNRSMPLDVDDVAVTWREAGKRLYSASLAIPAVRTGNGEGAHISSTGVTLDLNVHIDTGEVHSGALDGHGVMIVLPEDAATIRIDHLTASVTHEEIAPWRGQAEVDFRGLAVTGDDGTTVTLAAGHATTWFDDVMATLDEDVLAEGASLKGTVALEGLAGAGLSGMRADVESSLLEFTVAETGRITLRYSHEGLTLEDAGLAPVAPQVLAGDVNLEGAPVGSLLAALDRPGLPEGATLALGLDWGWPDGAGAISGQLASAPLAPVPATGTIRLVTSGMEDLVENVRSEARAGDRLARHLVTYLALFRAMGRHDETASEPRLIHDIVLLPDGRILVNDNDINILLNLLGAD